MSRLFVEHRGAVVAEVDVTRRRLGEQGRRELRLSCDVLPEWHVTLEVVCVPSVGGSPWLLPASPPRSSAMPLKPGARPET